MVRSATSTALRVAARELELYDTGDVAGADEVFAPDLIDHNPAGDAASAIDGMRALIAAVRDGFTDTQHRIMFQGELAGGWVVLHWRMTATQTGDAFGFAASGNPVDINGSDIMRVVDLVVLDRDYFTIPEDDIRLIRPVFTIVGGKVTFPAEIR